MFHDFHKFVRNGMGLGTIVSVPYTPWDFFRECGNPPLPDRFENVLGDGKVHVRDEGTGVTELSRPGLGMDPVNFLELDDIGLDFGDVGSNYVEMSVGFDIERKK